MTYFEEISSYKIEPARNESDRDVICKTINDYWDKARGGIYWKITHTVTSQVVQQITIGYF